MPLYTWLDVYRHRIPTGSARLSYNVPFPRCRLFSFSLYLSFSCLLLLPSYRPRLPPRLRNPLPVPMKVATWSIELLLSLLASPAYVLSVSLTLSFFLHLCSRFSPIPVSCSHPSDELRCVVTSAVGLSRDLGYDSITSVEAMKNAASSKNRQLSKYFKCQRAGPILRDHGTPTRSNALPLQTDSCIRRIGSCVLQWYNPFVV